MQKQHLRALLLICGACWLAGCGERKFSPLNPYLHGEQGLSFVLPDSVRDAVFVRGWEFEPLASLGFTSGPMQVHTPDGRTVLLEWWTEGGTEPIRFNRRVQSVLGIECSNSTLGLTNTVEVAPDGRSLRNKLSGAATSKINAQVRVVTSGMRVRGLAAQQQPWSQTEQEWSLNLPWEDRWRFKTEGEIDPQTTTNGDLACTMSFANSESREYTIYWSELASSRRDRGLDIVCENDTACQALALLISSIPPVHHQIPLDPGEREEAADRALAQWLVHAEFTKSYLQDLGNENAQVEFITYGLMAYRALFDWGCLSDADIVAAKPLFDATMSNFDMSSRSIALGASLEERLREATVWTLAEEKLASDDPNVRTRYREQAVEALGESQDEMRKQFVLKRKEQRKRADSSAIYEQFIGEDDSYLEGAPDEVREEMLALREKLRQSEPPFIPTDTISVLNIVRRGNFGWIQTVGKEWREMTGLPWPIELAYARWKFQQSLRLRTSDHWQRVQAALVNPMHPGKLPREEFGAAPMQSATAEIEMVAHTYLGIQPQWSARKITIHPHLPEGWGRTRARIPFADGEIYVDYDFANRQAWIAANYIMHEYTCVFYMPTPTGALSGQFRLDPGDSPLRITLVTESENQYRLRFESADLPE